MSLPPLLRKLFSYIEDHKSNYIENLREAIAIPSVSAWPDHRNETCEMAEWTAVYLRKLGCEVTLKNVGFQKLSNEEDIQLPPVIFATLGDDPTKKTICIYGHLDVQPAVLEDGWDSKPFELTERDGKLYGRGSTDDKGPVLCWLHAVEAYQALGLDIPVNIKFIFESMEESGSLGLEELLVKEKENYLNNIDYVCISDNYWLGTDKPTLTYGLRGVCYFQVEVECAAQDLHSGIYGGTVHEAMADLIYLLSTLTDKKGEIVIPGFLKNVAPPDSMEYDIYEKISFDVDDYRRTIGCNKLAHNEDKVQLLMHRWRYPALSIHGIEGAFAEPGAKTVIPRKVIGKFSIRTVPDQTADEVEQLVVSYLETQWKNRESPNNMRVSMLGSGNPFSEDPFHPHYSAGRRATEYVYGVDPDLIRDGGSVPILLTFQKVIGKNILLLAVGSGDDGAHSQNEKLNVTNYIQGTKLLGAYLYEAAQL